MTETITKRRKDDFDPFVVAKRQRLAIRRTRALMGLPNGAKVRPRNGMCQYAAIQERYMIMEGGYEILEQLARSGYHVFWVTYIFERGIVPEGKLTPGIFANLVTRLGRAVRTLTLNPVCVGAIEPKFRNAPYGSGDWYLHFHGLIAVEKASVADLKREFKFAFSQRRNDNAGIARPLMFNRLTSKKGVERCLRYCTKSFHLDCVHRQESYMCDGALRVRGKWSLLSKQRKELAAVYAKLPHGDRLVLVGVQRKSGRLIRVGSGSGPSTSVDHQHDQTDAVQTDAKPFHHTNRPSLSNGVNQRRSKKGLRGRAIDRQLNFKFDWSPPDKNAP